MTGSSMRGCHDWCRHSCPLPLLSIEADCSTYFWAARRYLLSLLPPNVLTSGSNKGFLLGLAHLCPAGNIKKNRNSNPGNRAAGRPPWQNWPEQWGQAADAAGNIYCTDSEWWGWASRETPPATKAVTQHGALCLLPVMAVTKPNAWTHAVALAVRSLGLTVAVHCHPLYHVQIPAGAW
jgi:hypothetical protein